MTHIAHPGPRKKLAYIALLAVMATATSLALAEKQPREQSPAPDDPHCVHCVDPETNLTPWEKFWLGHQLSWPYSEIIQP